MDTSIFESSFSDFLTIDLWIKILVTVVFNPLFWATFVLTRLAYIQPVHGGSLGYFMFIVTSIGWILYLVNERVAWGRARKMDWKHEVVVITGGSGGLGRVIADTYGMRGVSVAVLDVKPMSGDSETEGQNVKWYECDVGSAEAAMKVKGQIEKDVGSVSDILLSRTIISSITKTDRLMSSLVSQPSSSTMLGL